MKFLPQFARSKELLWLTEAISSLRDESRKTASGSITGTVVAADTSLQTVTLRQVIAGEVIDYAGIPVVGNYIPEVGHLVTVTMDGSAPIVGPPAMPLTSAAPPQVSGVIVTPAAGGLTVSWAALLVADVKWNRGYYQVQIDTVSTFNSVDLITQDVAATAVLIGQLRIGTTYYVRVRAVDYVGVVGAYSTTLSAVPVAADALAGGPELLSANTATLETTASGWVAEPAATIFQFNTTTGSWVGSNATLSFEDTLVYNPPGSLQINATSTTCEARSPAGTSGVPTVAGNRHRIIAPVIALAGAGGAGSTMTPCIRWWTSGGVQVGADVLGTSVTVDDAVWRVGIVDAVAPATSAFLSIVYKFSGVASGEVFFADEASISSPANSAVIRDTAQFHSGAASLRIRSLAAGVAVGGTPDTGDGTGYAVEAGSWYYWRMYYRGTSTPANAFAYVVPTWFDNSGVAIKVGFDATTSVLDTPTTAWQLYGMTWQCPPGATRLSVRVAFLATAANQDLHIDDSSLTKASSITSGVWQSPPETSSDPAQAAQQMRVFLRNTQTGFPFMEAQGHVYYRGVHARIRKSSGTQTIPNGVRTAVVMDQVIEKAGMDAFAPNSAASYIVCKRTGFYNVAAQISWSAFLTTQAGSLQIEVWRYSADGSTAPERISGNGIGVPNASGGGGFPMSTAMGARVNKGERIYAIAFQNCNATGTSITSGLGVFHMLSVTYEGDANPSA